MNISNIGIYDFNESIVASGLPMMAEYSEKWFENEVELLAKCADITSNPHFKRAVKLASNPAGSGHCNFLSGITVAMNVTATNVWWMQMERYHFVQIVSSQSKMHRLKQMVMEGNKYPFDKKTDIDAICVLHCLGEDEDADDEKLVYSCPMGLELTARITTNYLQLKTIWNQRHNHKLTEWKDFCRFIESLPFAPELIITNKGE